MTGSKVVRDDYSEGRVRIAFRPADAMFAVADAATDKDPEFIPDISALWVPGERKNVVRAFLRRLEAKRELSEAETDRLDEAINRVHDLRDYPFKAVELASAVQRGAVRVEAARRAVPDVLAARQPPAGAELMLEVDDVAGERDLSWRLGDRLNRISRIRRGA